MRYCPQSFEKDISLSVIYKILNTQYTRNIADKLKRRYHVFIGVCYVFTYSSRQKVIWK